VVLSVLNGWRRGFILGALDLLGWILSLLAALRFYRPLANWLGPRIDFWAELWDAPLSFLLIAVVSGIVVHLLTYALLSRLSEETHNIRINKLLGTVPGLANGLIASSILSALLLAIPFNQTLRERTRDSALVNRLAGYTQRLETALVPVFQEAFAETLNLLTIRPESTERVLLPYKVPSSLPKPELEAEMLKLINKERATAGLPALAADPELTPVARKHSSDMFARGYFAHVSPERQDPFDRIREANIPFTVAGENLALARTLKIAHTGLMNSPGHRANILQKDFGRVGIGVMDGGARGLMITQNFRN
jgi:uncharacterized protein YkwD